MISLLAATQVTLVLSVPAPLDAERMLAAITQAEGWKGRAGRHGEWGRWQILPVVWRKHSKVPQRFATADEEKRVALAHLADIRRQLKAAGFPDGPWFIGGAWNGGVSGVIRRALPARARDYADRVEALYGSK